MNGMTCFGMDGLDFNPPTPPEARPRTISVLGLLAMAAGVFSYLWAYCLTDALVAVEMLSPLPRGEADPRPKWFVSSWFVLMIVFMFAGYFLQQLSRRELNSIDEMERYDEPA